MATGYGGEGAGMRGSAGRRAGTTDNPSGKASRPRSRAKLSLRGKGPRMYAVRTGTSGKALRVGSKKY